MSKTKAELHEDLKTAHQKVDALDHEVRRLKRSIGQMSLDLQAAVAGHQPLERTVYPTERALEAIKRAEVEWARNVTEPEYKGDYQRITAYIKSQDGLGWTWESDYTKNGQFSWCGAFVAFAYGRALHAALRKKVLPSCYRLWDQWGRSARLRDGEKPQPGDIVVVYTDESHKPIQGNHITLCVGEPNELGLFSTIEGNAHGMGPEGRIEGVIKRERDVDSIAHIYRLLPEDFEER